MPGAVMYHGVYGPLFVQYAIFEPEKIVVMLKVIPMPNTPLDVPLI